MAFKILERDIRMFFKVVFPSYGIFMNNYLYSASSINKAAQAKKF